MTGCYHELMPAGERRLQLLRDPRSAGEARRLAPAVRERASDETGGWGLQIVDQLALQWGVLEGTTHVWADLALD